MNEWSLKVPHSQLCNKNCSILKITNTEKKATHLMDSSKLKSFGISKYEVIIDSLADFVALTFASSAVGQTKSLYFDVARKLAQYGGPEAIAAWINGYKPQTKNTTN
jgi:hypothetical protein